MTTPFPTRREFVKLGLAALGGPALFGWPKVARAASTAHDYRFERTISREVLENYLDRAITMEGMLHGRGNLDDDVRMLKHIGAKFLGRSVCLWAGEANLLENLKRVKRDAAKVREADPDMVVQACIFEIVTSQVEQVPVPDWAFQALGMPAESRNFRYADMLYPGGKFHDHWHKGASVPDVSRPETQVWFHFLAASYIDAGAEAIHFGQMELMNHNDRDLKHYSAVLDRARSHAANHARRRMLLCDAHVPGGGLIRNGKLLLDFHSFPLRVKEVPGEPIKGILEVGYADSFYGRSRGGKTFSGWECEHLPYLVEIDNWGASKHPGKPNLGDPWIWGYDEMSWFAHLSEANRNAWLRYAWKWVRETDPNGHLQMPGGRVLHTPVDGKHWYHANTPGPATPGGFGQEETIRAIWEGDAA